MRKLIFQLYKKKNKKKRWDDIFFSMEYHVYWSLKSFCFEFFRDKKYGIFWAKKLMEIWYLLITEKFLFWIFWRWKIWSFLRQKVNGKMKFTGYSKVLVLNFSVMGNTVFFQPKSWWKDDIYLVFLSFPWYSRTWGIWCFVRCVEKRLDFNYWKIKLKELHARFDPQVTTSNNTSLHQR